MNGTSTTAGNEAPQGPTRALALAIIGVTFVAYVIFNYYRVGDQLYAWSKTIAPYEFRQYLGMSKRWAMQYGHIVFLFTFFVLSKYVLRDITVKPRVSAAIGKAVPYTLPVFIFHFPLLYFLTSLGDHDPNDPIDQVVLFFGTLLACFAFGRLCLLLKPLFDRFQRWLAGMVPEGGDAPPALKPIPLSQSFSDFLKCARMVATLSIFFGHYTFAQFSTATLPGFDHWRRWAVPFFFMTSGYFAMRSIEGRRGGALGVTVNRYTSLWFMVVPMLCIVPILDHIGFEMDPMLYYLHQKFVTPTDGGPVDLAGFATTFVNSALYLNELFIYDLLGFGTSEGGMRTFSNDSYWFLCYLMPFTAMLAIMVKIAGWRKYVWLVVIAVFFGPPILMLSPLFFAGCIAYRIHRSV